MTDRQLIDQFTNGVGNAFHAYKKNSSIKRTFVNCNFKEKPSKVDNEKVKKIIEEERMRIKRLKSKSKKLVDGEKNFWRKKMKRRNQSVSIS